MGWLNHRGLSPLIATVLLMAFAVAIGGMIMSWAPWTRTNCANVKTSIDQLCYADGAVFIKLRNSGSTVIPQLTLNFSQPTLKPGEARLRPIDLLDQPLNPSNAFEMKVSIGSVLSNETSAALIASIGDPPVACAEPLAHSPALPKC
jgi:flagellin-like protein